MGRRRDMIDPETGRFDPEYNPPTRHSTPEEDDDDNDFPSSYSGPPAYDEDGEPTGYTPGYPDGDDF